MKKIKFITLLLLATLTLSFNACSSDNNEEDNKINYNEINGIIKQYEQSTFTNGEGITVNFGADYPLNGISRLDTEFYDTNIGTYIGYFSYTLTKFTSNIKEYNFGANSYFFLGTSGVENEFGCTIILVNRDEIKYGDKTLKRK